jgi:purine-nucleoside phosphorylase
MEKYKQTCDFIKQNISMSPVAGIILGSGLGDLTNLIQNPKTLKYEDIPNFIGTGVDGHQGNLVFGYIDNIPVVIMQGRNHYYEGHSMSDVTFPIRVMGMLGVKSLITTNAVGGINQSFKVGDIMLVNDHINLMNNNPLIGKHNPEFGERFVNMSSVYDKDLIGVGILCGHRNRIRIKEGVLTALSGPTYETPAEYRFLKLIGSDAVGMSTIPEVIVAKQMGMRIFSMSVVTNMIGDLDANHEDVQNVANQSVSGVWKIINDVIKWL